MSLNPYVYFDGQCEEAFKFYEKCLDGKITFTMRWEGSPMADQAPGWGKKTLHPALALGDDVLEGCDAMPEQYKKPHGFCLMFKPKDIVFTPGKAVNSCQLVPTTCSRSHCNLAYSSLAC